ncbi:MAG: hypothetical protein JW820_05955 [Spirochaetales bacterium]|nr:hypothetical protein [Spirochaetales bacterium]
MKLRRSSTALLVAVLLAPAGVHAQELAAWIPSTDRSMNPVIAPILAEGPLQDRVAAAEALGLRRDPFVADLVGALLALRHGPRAHEAELVLRVLLASVFPRSAAPEGLREPLAQNREALELLAAALPELRAPLAREVYRLLSLLDEGRFTAALADEGRRLNEQLARRHGRSDAEQADRLMAYLEAAQRSGDPRLAPAVIGILETTMTAEVGQRAREVLSGTLRQGSAQ